MQSYSNDDKKTFWIIVLVIILILVLLGLIIIYFYDETDHTSYGRIRYFYNEPDHTSYGGIRSGHTSYGKIGINKIFQSAGQWVEKAKKWGSGLNMQRCWSRPKMHKTGGRCHCGHGHGH